MPIAIQGMQPGVFRVWGFEGTLISDEGGFMSRKACMDMVPGYGGLNNG